MTPPPKREWYVDLALSMAWVILALVITALGIFLLDATIVHH